MISLFFHFFYVWWRDGCWHTNAVTVDDMVFRCPTCLKWNIHGYGWH